jgi:hypothetical protein
MKGISVSIVILVAALGALTGCGSSVNGGNGGGNALTQAQAQEVGTAISNDISNALSSALTSPSGVPLDISSRDHIRVALERKSETKAVAKPDSVTCVGSSCAISGTYACPGGGSIQISGDFSGTSNTVSGNVTGTPSNCSDTTIDISGDPNIRVGLQGSDNGISTSVSVTLSGGVSFSPVQAGQFPSGSATFDLTIRGTLNDSTKAVTACSISGSIGGQNINENCSNLP